MFMENDFEMDYCEPMGERLDDYNVFEENQLLADREGDDDFFDEANDFDEYYEYDD